MLKMHKPNHKLFLISITSILSVSVLLGFSALTYTPDLSHAETITYEPPKETRTMDNITYMQEITPEICQNSELNKQYTLIDSRDNSDYTVARIKNQTNDESNCWMTQNLRLTNYKLTSADSDVVEDYTLPTSTTLSSTDNPKQFSESDTYESKVYYDASHPEYGAYYNWYTATVGTGEPLNAGRNSMYSLCPKGWRLPTADHKDSDLFNLTSGLVADVYTNELTIAPYFFALAGTVYKSELLRTTIGGTYWSSTTYSSASSTNINVLSVTYHGFGMSNASRFIGYSIRCLARTESTPSNNIDITINPTISIDVTDEINVEKSDINPSTAAFSALVASNQPYSVSISSNSPNMTSSTSDVVIPSKSGTLTSNENAWGIKLSTASTYEQITTTPKLFYSSTSPESKSLPFTIGISTASDLPNGEYSTSITITATQN